MRPERVAGVVPRASMSTVASSRVEGKAASPGRPDRSSPRTRPARVYAGASPGAKVPRSSKVPCSPASATSKRTGAPPPPWTEMGPVTVPGRSPGRPSSIPRRKFSARPETS